MAGNNNRFDWWDITAKQKGASKPTIFTVAKNRVHQQIEQAQKDIRAQQNVADKLKGIYDGSQSAAQNFNVGKNALKTDQAQANAGSQNPTRDVKEKNGSASKGGKGATTSKTVDAQGNEITTNVQTTSAETSDKKTQHQATRNTSTTQTESGEKKLDEIPSNAIQGLLDGYVTTMNDKYDWKVGGLKVYDVYGTADLKKIRMALDEE